MLNGFFFLSASFHYVRIGTYYRYPVILYSFFYYLSFLPPSTLYFRTENFEIKARLYLFIDFRSPLRKHSSHIMSPNYYVTDKDMDGYFFRRSGFRGLSSILGERLADFS